MGITSCVRLSRYVQFHLVLFSIILMACTWSYTISLFSWLQFEELMNNLETISLSSWLQFEGLMNSLDAVKLGGFTNNPDWVRKGSWIIWINELLRAGVNRSARLFSSQLMMFGYFYFSFIPFFIRLFLIHMGLVHVKVVGSLDI